MGPGGLGRTLCRKGYPRQVFKNQEEGEMQHGDPDKGQEYELSPTWLRGTRMRKGVVAEESRVM